MCTATERRWLCLQREPRRDVDPVDVDQLTSFSYRTAAGLACSAPCPASVGRAAPSARTIFILTRRRGVPTRHTHKWDADGLRPRHLLESTHTQTHTNTNNANTQCGPTKYGADSRRGGALLIRGARAPRALAPTPSELWSLHISVAISHAEVTLCHEEEDHDGVHGAFAMIVRRTCNGKAQRKS